MRSLARVALAVGLCTVCCPRASAWIYPEHRAIGVAAWQRLSPQARDFLRVLWGRAQFGYSAGLCQTPVAAIDRDDLSDEGGPCIDYPAWAAIAGDHSCSPDELIDEVLPSRWVHDVARVSERVRRELAEVETEEARENLWITSNLRLQEADAEYVTRAGANNAHFLLPLERPDLAAFIARSTRDGAPLNALGLYVQYHAAALQLASAIGPDPQHAPSSLVRRVLALEAYALHFLQDMFASGHVAGTWGDVATRKGTHDYYCAHGYSTTTWSGRSLVMYGDAHIRRADLERSSAIMAASLRQVVEAALTGTRADTEQRAAAAKAAALDSCKRLTHPATGPIPRSMHARMKALLADTPMPGHGPDSAAWPRYRADFGPFLGVVSTVSLGSALTGYGGPAARAIAELGVGLRLGYGLEGVVASVNTGTMFLQLGLVRQSEQIDYCVDDCPDGLGSPGLPRVPSRPGVAVALRMPFWLIPGDLLILAPLLALVSPSDLAPVAIRAASGGLIPWQRTFQTPIGAFEAVVGRHIGATFHGLAQRTRTYVPVELEQGPDNALARVGFRSVALTFPVIEYTPFRTVAQALTASLQLQLVYGIDIPIDVVMYADIDAGAPDWKPAHMMLLTISMNGRGYL